MYLPRTSWIPKITTCSNIQYLQHFLLNTRTSLPSSGRNTTSVRSIDASFRPFSDGDQIFYGRKATAAYVPKSIFLNLNLNAVSQVTTYSSVFSINRTKQPFHQLSQFIRNCSGRGETAFKSHQFFQRKLMTAPFSNNVCLRALASRTLTFGTGSEARLRRLGSKCSTNWSTGIHSSSTTAYRINTEHKKAIFTLKIHYLHTFPSCP